MTCTTCHRNAVRGELLCQRCRHRAYPMQGPIHEPACEVCRDSGRVYAGRCDIPGCVHWRRCECSPRIPDPHEVYR